MLENGFVKNPNNASVPEIRWLEPETAEHFWLSNGEDMYDLIENVQVLRFLEESQATEDIFKAALC